MYVAQEPVNTTQQGRFLVTVAKVGKKFLGVPEHCLRDNIRLCVPSVVEIIKRFVEGGTPHRDASVQCLDVQRLILKLVFLYNKHGSFNFSLGHFGERIHRSLREQRVDNIPADFVFMRIL